MQTPAWDLSSIYPSLESREFVADLDALRLPSFRDENATSVAEIREFVQEYERLSIIASQLSGYLHCLLAVDSKNAVAKARVSEVEALSSDLNQFAVPIKARIQTCGETFFQELVAQPELRGYLFMWRAERAQVPYRLDDATEIAIEALGVPGHKAWENLYYDLSGRLTCTVDGKSIGISEALAHLYGSDEALRRKAWEGVQGAWSEHEETAAAIVNSLADWRLQSARRRSKTKTLHFLDPSLTASRITRETLGAMMSATRERREELRGAPSLMAQLLGKKQLDPWDLTASYQDHGAAPIPFAEGAEWIREAFAALSPEMGAFVEEALSRGWIDARPLPNKTTGAFCSTFAKTMEPRVLQTYLGSLSDVVTLAHELGHAFHTVTLRGLPFGEIDFPSTLAETASLFGEFAVRDSFSRTPRTSVGVRERHWAELESISAYLLDVPARFEFERELHEQRQHGFISAERLSDLMQKSWRDSYGDTITQPERLFWARKLHFAGAGAGFYNYPYVFGYLFALSLYTRRVERGTAFMPAYIDLLKDTGRMTAEDLAQKHLSEDIRKPKFWAKALDFVVAKLHDIEADLNRERRA